MRKPNVQQALGFTAHLDPAARDGLGYVVYRRLAPGEHVARTERVSYEVRVDYDANAAVLGIELLALDDATFDVARAWAAEHDLGFPAILGPRAVPS